MPEQHAFEYAVMRAVPDVAREEFINVGVILYCRARRFLDARVHVDAAKLAALAPSLGAAALLGQVEAMPRICAGGPDAGPIGRLSQAERFRWLTSPRSTMLQPSPVHTGICDDPQAMLESLFRRMVAGETEGAG